MIKKVGSNTYYSKRTGAVYASENFQEVKSGRTSPYDDDWSNPPIQPISQDGYEIAPWGRYNLKPLELLNMMANSNITPQLLTTLSDFAVGEGMFPYIEVMKEVAPGQYDIMPQKVDVPQVTSWLNNMDGMELMRKRATDYYFSGNMIANMIPARNPDRHGIAYVQHVDSLDWRSGTFGNKSRKVDFHYICDDWRMPVVSQEKNNVLRFNAWRKTDPFKWKQSLHHSKLYWPGQKFYGIQPWHAAKKWIVFANKIPVWMDANISNSYSIRWLVEWPENYFDYMAGKSEKQIEDEKDRVFKEMDDFLAGEENAGKAFYTRRKMANPIQGTGEGAEWVIKPLKQEIYDKAWLDTYKTTQGAMTSAFNVNPALANIPSEGKFAVSGSELRIAYQMHIALKVQAARELMVKPLMDAYRVNHSQGVVGFEIPDLKFGFVNRNIVALSEDKSGVKANIQSETI